MVFVVPVDHDDDLHDSEDHTNGPESDVHDIWPNGKDPVQENIHQERQNNSPDDPERGGLTKRLVGTHANLLSVSVCQANGMEGGGEDLRSDVHWTSWSTPGWVYPLAPHALFQAYSISLRKIYTI